MPVPCGRMEVFSPLINLIATIYVKYSKSEVKNWYPYNLLALTDLFNGRDFIK
jgi:hypothetical protein